MAQAGGLTIREATPADADAIWRIFREVIAGGDAFAWAPGTSREECDAAWFGLGVSTFVAEAPDQRGVVGAYFVKPNQPGLGSHVANAAYMVAPWARGLGVGEAMGRHSLEAARALGYRAMQFNLVVSTNDAAVALWTKLGFRAIATLPQAFRHARLGFVDAYLLHRFLDPPD